MQVPGTLKPLREGLPANAARGLAQHRTEPPNALVEHAGVAPSDNKVDERGVAPYAPSVADAGARSRI
eukprot:3963263-Alexandrium_andersonii.AAC.1